MATIKQLQAFYWAARLQSFTAVAERLYSTQSAISLRIQELEASFGVELFDRSQRKIRLTQKGEELLVYADRMLQLEAEMEQNISDRDAISGRVRIGVSEVIALTWLSRMVQQLRAKYPKLVISYEVSLTTEMFRRLRAGGEELILSPGFANEPDLAGSYLGSLQFEWMVGGDLKVPEGELTPADLAKLPVLCLNEQSYHYTRTEQWFRQAGTTLTRADICNSLGVLCALTEAGAGVALLPVVPYQAQIRARKLRVLRVSPPIVPMDLYAIRSAQARPIVHLVAQVAQQVSDFRRSPAPTAPQKRGNSRAKRNPD